MKTQQQSINLNSLFAFAGYGFLALLIIIQWTSLPEIGSDLGISLMIKAGLAGSGIELAQSGRHSFFSTLELGLAVAISLCAPTQWLMKVREKAPVFLQWSSAFYIDLALAMSACGLIIGLSPVLGGKVVLANFISLINAALIAWIAFNAMSATRRADLSAYQQWAMRLFLVVSGYWLVLAFNFTSGLMGDIETEFMQPFSNLMCSVLMLASYELYLKQRLHSEDS